MPRACFTGQSRQEKTNVLPFRRALDTGNTDVRRIAHINTFSSSSRSHAKLLAQLHTGVGDPWVPETCAHVCKDSFPRGAQICHQARHNCSAQALPELRRSRNPTRRSPSCCLPFCKTRGKANASGCWGWQDPMAPQPPSLPRPCSASQGDAPPQPKPPCPPRWRPPLTPAAERRPQSSSQKAALS